MGDRVDHAGRCSQSDFLMAPWKIDKKAWSGGPAHAALRCGMGYNFLHIRTIFCNIMVLQHHGTHRTARRTKKPHLNATLQCGKLGVDLDAALT
jgi:hypothetical protein